MSTVILPGPRGRPWTVTGVFNPNPRPGARERAMAELVRIWTPVLEQIIEADEERKRHANAVIGIRGDQQLPRTMDGQTGTTGGH